MQPYPYPSIPYQTQPAQTPEGLIYQDLNVTVTTLRLIAGSKTFYLSQLSTAQPVEIEPKRIYPSILMAIGVIIMVSGISQLLYTNQSSGLAGIGIALPCFIGGLVWHKLQKKEYAVRIGTPAGETNAFISEDWGYVLRVAQTINQAKTLAR